VIFDAAESDTREAVAMRFSEPSRRFVLVGLVGALLAVGGCAGDGQADGPVDGAVGGGTAMESDARALPPGTYTWLLHRKGSSNARCGGESCPAPAWGGRFEVAKDGSVSGNGTLGLAGSRPGKLDPYEDMVCTGGGGDTDSILPEQDVTVSGAVPAEGRAEVRLEFAAEVVRNERRLGDCDPEVFGTLADKWEGLEPLLLRGATRTVALQGANGEARVDVNGIRYAFYW
jgi:hypothetical protein